MAAASERSERPGGRALIGAPGERATRSYALVIEYDGSSYHGWQIQAGGLDTIQGQLQKALGRLAGREIAVVGSGRTDAGVHAIGQVAGFEAVLRLTPIELRRALNAILPPDIRVRHARQVATGFHARYGVIRKTYFYQVHQGSYLPPLRRHTFLHESRPLDVGAMRRAGRYLVGRYDFRSFSTGVVRRTDTVRTLSSLRIEPIPSGLRLFVTADGFLYNMVRGLVGALLAVGRGDLCADMIPSLRDAADRRRAPATAPARGLVLWRVLYPISHLIPQPPGAAAKRGVSEVRTDACPASSRGPTAPSASSTRSMGRVVVPFEEMRRTGPRRAGRGRPSLRGVVTEGQSSGWPMSVVDRRFRSSNLATERDVFTGGAS